MKTSVRAFFERYEQVFRCALRGDAEMEEAAQLYAPEFIASTPAGVVSGKNDAQLAKVMAQGYARYRAQGMKDMRLQSLHTSPIDDDHCLAHVAWTATYAREGRPDVAIDFQVHYFVRGLGSEPKVFGWVSGDEQALLERHGLA